MKLYLLERTPLSALPAATPAPEAGDVVAFFREGQAPYGKGLDELRRRDVTVIQAEALIGVEEEAAIEDFVDRFLRNWCLDGEPEIGRTPPLSLGFIVAYHASLLFDPGFLIRFGETCRCLFDRFPHVEAVVNDIADGLHPLVFFSPAVFPKRRLLDHLASAKGIGLIDLSGPKIPLYFHRRFLPDRYLESIFRSFLGGFRLRFLVPRLALRFRKRKTPRIYFFLNHGIRLTAETVAARGNVNVVVDQAGHSGLVPLRHDHFLPLPSFKLLAAYIGLWRHVSRLARSSGFAVFNGFDYSPFLAPGVRSVRGGLLVSAIIKGAQMERMLRRLRPDLVIINGVGSVHSRVAILSDAALGYRVIYIGHSLNSMPYRYWPATADHPNVTFVVPGRGHMDLYAQRLPEDRKPRRVVLPIPITSQVERSRGKRPVPPLRRVMVLSYSPRTTDSVAHAKYCDRFTLDVLAAARNLLEKGVHTTIRPKPVISAAYLDHMIEAAGLKEKLEIDRSPEFADALKRCDVVVSTNSTAYYQALYAGWPTIYYHPSFKRHEYIGLLADADIDAPVAQTPEQLVRMVLEAFDPKSRVARFPEVFNQKYAEHYLGPDPQRTDQQLAEFLIGEAIDAAAKSGHVPPAV